MTKIQSAAKDGFCSGIEFTRPKGPTCRSELDDFLHACRLERRLAPLTCSAHERDVKACLRFLADRGIDDLGLVRPPDLRAFLAEETNRRRAAGSQARTVATLKCFFRFCLENEYLDRDPAHALRTSTGSAFSALQIDALEGKGFRCAERDRTARVARRL